MPMLTSVPFEVADTAEEKMDWDRETAGTEAEAEESMSTRKMVLGSLSVDNTF